ncbi:CHAT domain-containing protein [Streptomyces bungoensis]|uniref:CHAT domain-containing protein n=1 Tax=Streptomyces bungoensis TaxID=285568 RepID=UPI0007C63C38|nr:CHAT domain-containing protein [Streptomyces bungoensis]
MSRDANELTEAQYGSVICVDAGGFGRYGDADVPRMRARMYRVLEAAFAHASVERDALHLEDRGDGVLAAVASGIAPSRLLGPWLVEVYERLRHENRDLRVPLGLRIGMHVGPVLHDARGVSGRAVDLACRLADSAVARRLLATEGVDLVLVISESLYEDVVRSGGRFIEPAHFSPAPVRLKDGEVTAWCHLPGRPAPGIPGPQSAGGTGDFEDTDGLDARRAEAPDHRSDGRAGSTQITVHGDMSQHHDNVYQQPVHVGRVTGRGDGDRTADRPDDHDERRPTPRDSTSPGSVPIGPTADRDTGARAARGHEPYDERRTTTREGDPGATGPLHLVAELAEQTSPGRVVPLQVRIVQSGTDGRGGRLRPFAIPSGGARVLVTLHSPGLIVLDELQQELHVMPGRDSDVLLFRLKAPAPGLHRVTVRAFRGGTFLGEVTCQTSVEHGSVTRDGHPRDAPLPSMAFDPGEVTLQVLRDEAAGSFSFQLISERCYAPETFRFRAGDPRRATEQIYAELRNAARAAATDGNEEYARRLRDRLRSHGVRLWASAVPEAVQRQFWAEAGRITSFTVLGEHDMVPWELLYPLNDGQEDRGFLAEWLPVVRRVFGQDRVRELGLPGVAFVVPPGSPANAGAEVASLRARLGPGVADAGVLTERAALTALIEGGHAGLLHFACHNAFTGTGSCVTMADGPFDPIDLTSAAQLRTLRAHHPLVFFNACRSAGEIDWFGESLGWAPQFLQAGAGAFVGTLWPVRSRSALRFAEAFYDQLLTHGQSLGQASLAARRTVRDLHGGDPTWLAYAVYGSPAAKAHTTAPAG